MVFTEREAQERCIEVQSAERLQKLTEFSEMLKVAGIDPKELLGSMPTIKSDHLARSKRSPRPAKYRFYENGQEKTWTGQGRMPKVIADAVANGQALEEFLIEFK